jgi:hypothetical protein
MRFFILLTTFLTLSFYSLSQEHDHQHDVEHHHPELELGFSSGAVYNFTEKEIAPGIHIHIIKTVSKTDMIGIGFGYEAIFDDHKHNAASFIILYRPFEHVSFNFAPGISWLSTEEDSAKPSLHLEALYEWEFGNFHIGPLLGLASNFEDFHGSIGLHFAIGF